MDPSAVQPVTPQEIITLVLAEMEAETAPSYYSVIVRSIYQVYLHPDEMEKLRPVLPHVREEAVRALNERLTALNRPKWAWLPFGRPKQKRYKTLGDWVVEFHENTDDDAAENPLIIHSAFALPRALDDRVGAMTERVVRRGAGGQTIATTRTAASETQPTKSSVYAVLEYEDNTGPHTYEMTKNQVKIGRGGEHVWVDLKLEATRDISREHLQLRRDAASGRFYVKDLSKLGTTVNGRTVPPSVAVENGSEIDRNIEAPLPDKARIGLAGVLFLEFKAVKD
jgi:hypothetical protein